MHTATAPTGRTRIIAAGTIGNILEWYDFSIYGFLAVQIGAAFFPTGDPLSQALSAFSVFAAGFLARPLGAIAIGHIGDRAGRSTALTISIGGMIVATLGMGLVPDHATIGVAAPILLTVLRLIQGLAVGGESAIANVFMIENAPPGRRGLSGAIGGAGYAVGIQLASLTALACASVLSPAELQAWGWRIPFWLSLVVALSGLYVRRTLKELPKPAAGERPSPLAEVFANHLPLVLRIAGLSAFAAIGFQAAFIYIADWLQRVGGASPAATFEVTSVSMLLVTPMSIFFGWLADHVGRRNLLLASAALGMLGSIPFFILMRHNTAAGIHLGQAGFVLVLGVQFGVQGALMVETTPEPIRCTALAIGNNIAWSILGGLTPLAATWLIYRTGDDLSPAWLVVAAAGATIVALLMAPDTFRKEISTGSRPPL